jgi:CelD/BcsL family acetyltransferase involved in cellulose biosynthesis
MSGRGAIRYVPRQYKRFFIDLRSSFPEYLAKFSAKTRSTLARKVRKFQDASGGRIEWREFKSPGEILGFYEQARAVSRLTYQEQLLKCGLPDSKAFRENLLSRSEAEAVRGYLLSIGGRPISYLYCPIADGVISYDHVGYDPAYAKLSPGTVLLYLVIESLFEAGQFSLFDFTEGEGSHKELFANHSIYCADVIYVRKQVSNRLKVSAHRLFEGASEYGVMIVTALGVKRALKKLLRGIVRG